MENKTSEGEGFIRDREQKTPVRLNKFLAEAGICSRREADRLIAQGAVTVDGVIAEMGQKVTSAQKIAVNGKEAVPEKEMILLAVNKPRGVVCTTEKKWNDVTIDTFLNYPRRVFSVGRLDKDSEGLLLMTNDGELQDKIMRSANCHEKEYEVEVDRPIDSAFIKKMERGVFLEELNVTTRPCRVIKTGQKKFTIVLTQGLNRQIRRMCRECGCSVISLKRVRIMNIRLGELPVGAYRPVSKAELEKLYEMLEIKDKERQQ
ncbi:MAG: pseudouridine synthase [Eubacteriales bacterium]|nr:pseudouridine synthase [Eubacteriales bacterium]